MREVIALEKTEKSKTGALSLFTLVTLAAGQVIGAGVVSTTGVAIAKTEAAYGLPTVRLFCLAFYLFFPLRCSAAWFDSKVETMRSFRRFWERNGAASIHFAIG